MYTLFSSAFSGFTRGASKWRMMEDLNSTILAFDDDNCTCRFAMFSFSHLYRIGNTVDWPDKRLLPSFVCFVLFFCWRQNSQRSASVVQGMPGHHWKGNLLRHHYRRFKKDSCEQEYNAGNIWHDGSTWYMHVHRYQDGTPSKMTDHSRREWNLQYAYVSTHSD